MENIIDWWLNFFEHSTFWNAFWPAVWGALVGAIAAFTLERRYRERDRISREIGQCSRLIFTLGQMVNVLDDLNDMLFEAPRKRLGRRPKWNEIGALPGAPVAGPGIVIGEFEFLLEDRDTTSNLPAVLNRAYISTSRYNAALGLLHERNQLVDQHFRLKASTSFVTGESAVPGMMEAEAVATRIEQLTDMLAEDLPEAIEMFEAVIKELRQTLEALYPGREFIGIRRKYPKEKLPEDPKSSDSV